MTTNKIMNVIEDFREIETWKVKSLKCLLGLKRDNSKGFLRSSQDEENNNIRITASLLAYSAILETSISSADDDNEMQTIIGSICENRSIDNENIYKDSANNKDRHIIPDEHLLSILDKVTKTQNKSLKFDFKTVVNNIRDFATNNTNKDLYYPAPGRSPWFTFLLIRSLLCLDSLEKKKNESTDIKNTIQEISKLIDDHINYHMARSENKEVTFDPISLLIALCCKLLIDVNFVYNRFFISCFKEAMKHQNCDGTWPTGATISTDDSGDIIQQSSVQISTYILDSIINYSLMTNANMYIDELLNAAIPVFRKTAAFLMNTLNAVKDSSGKIIEGWSSDRTRRNDLVETWITAYVCKFFYKYFLLEKAYSRSAALKFFHVSKHDIEQKVCNAPIKWSDLQEPDSILKPKSELDQIINPIKSEINSESFLITLEKNHVSFIICGPPGSGKTYAVTKLADELGWPLIELSPSQFISKGIEFIESTSKEIFDNIAQLSHAIVFFDECDELFKCRKLDTNANRTILNFLTASMLPKLQKLHDKRNVIFIIGTNYLHNIDKAVSREGRFDKLILWDRPDKACRQDIFKEKGIINTQVIDEYKANTIQQLLSVSNPANLQNSTSESPNCDESFKDISNAEKYFIQFSLDNSLSTEQKEYLKWIREDGLKELTCLRCSEQIKIKKLQSWKDELLPTK